MIFHGENHWFGQCVPSTYFATVGMSLSTDRGETWGIHLPIIGGPVPKPTNTAGPPALGDAIPSAVIDPAHNFVYVFFNNRGEYSHAVIMAARASLAKVLATLHSHGPSPFKKWQVTSGHGGWTGKGFGYESAADGSPILPTQGSGCSSSYDQKQADISYYPSLGGSALFVLTFLCQNASGNLGWYYSMTRNLSAESWTAPQLVHNSPAAYDSGSQTIFDWYPSLISSPNGSAGTGYVVYAHGVETQPKALYTRPFAIVTAAP
jgi:hypothetical protein